MPQKAIDSSRVRHIHTHTKGHTPVSGRRIRVASSRGAAWPPAPGTASGAHSVKPSRQQAYRELSVTAPLASVAATATATATATVTVTVTSRIAGVYACEDLCTCVLFIHDCAHVCIVYSQLP